MMISVLKRDGQVADFTLKKIGDAITKAFTATEKIYTDEIINLLALRVTADFQDKIKDSKVHGDIQDSVSGYDNRLYCVAKAYPTVKMRKMRNIKSTILDYKETVICWERAGS